MYSELIRLLELTGIPCVEDGWNNAPQTGSYIVYTLDGQGETLWADGSQQEQVLLGSVDLFARTNSRADFVKVQNALKSWGGSWDLYSIDTEPANHIKHYRWAFELEKL